MQHLRKRSDVCSDQLALPRVRRLLVHPLLDPLQAAGQHAQRLLRGQHHLQGLAHGCPFASRVRVPILLGTQTITRTGVSLPRRWTPRERLQEGRAFRDFKQVDVSGRQLWVCMTWEESHHSRGS